MLSVVVVCVALTGIFSIRQDVCNVCDTIGEGSREAFPILAQGQRRKIVLLEFYRSLDADKLRQYSVL